MGQTLEFRRNIQKSRFKSRHLIVDGRNTNAITRKRVRTPWSRKAKHRSKFYVQPSQEHNRIKSTRKQSLLAAKVRAELHLPFLDPLVDGTTMTDKKYVDSLCLFDPHEIWSVQSWLLRMRWCDDLRLDEKEKIWEDPGYAEDKSCISNYNVDNPPPWTLPPTRQPDEDIFSYVCHLLESWDEDENYIQLPDSWPVRIRYDHALRISSLCRYSSRWTGNRSICFS